MLTYTATLYGMLIQHYLYISSNTMHHKAMYGSDLVVIVIQIIVVEDGFYGKSIWRTRHVLDTSIKIKDEISNKQ